MTAFDRVIGYESIKTELLQICDMIHHPEIYTALGARMPQGILLHGDPGLGKSLMARCFIAESGLRAWTVRRNKSAGDFVGEITETFRKAKDSAPCIILLDDMDKFANEDNNHRDAEEYVAVQAGIDEVRDAGVFVFATVNDIRKLPHSLKRPGRFDRKIEVLSPSPGDAAEIIRYYLKGKPVSKDLNLEDIAMMINYSSCAELETILNESAIRAAYLRKDCVTMEDVVDTVLRTEYDSPESFGTLSRETLHRIALHEAGHLVVCEVLCPGSVGLASLRASGGNPTKGFIRRCRELSCSSDYVLAALGGKAAAELYYADDHTGGCESDLESAAEYIRQNLSRNGSCGLGLLDVETKFSSVMSESLNTRSESVVQAELERHLALARGLLLRNRDFLERTAEALIERETLLYSDIRELREPEESEEEIA